MSVKGVNTLNILCDNFKGELQYLIKGGTPICEGLNKGVMNPETKKITTEVLNTIKSTYKVKVNE